MIQDIQAYEKTAESHKCDHDQNESDNMLVPGSRVVVIIITPQGFLLSKDSTMTSVRRIRADNINPINSVTTDTIVNEYVQR